MSDKEIRENEYYVFGAMEYVRNGNKKVPKKIDGVEIWKCNNRYYWLQNGSFKKMTNSMLDK